MGVALPATVAFDYPTVQAIAAFVSDELAPPAAAAPHPPPAAALAAAAAAATDSGRSGGGFGHMAAVVGMGLRFGGTEQGGSDSADKYWCGAATSTD